MAAKPNPNEVKAYYLAKEYTFDLRKFWTYYADRDWISKGKPITDWKALMDSWNEYEFEKQSKLPDFELKKESKGNDMNKIYRDVFGKDGEWMYKRFLERKAALARLKERGVSPITIKDVDREMMCRYGIVQKPTP